MTTLEVGDTAEGALLAYLSEADRAYLLGLGVRRSFGAKEFVLLQGDPSDHVHILISGWVRVSAVVEDGREVLYALRGPGDVLGDIAAVSGSSRTASVRSLEPVTVVQLSGAQFLACLRARPEIAIAMIKSVVTRLRDAETARTDSAMLGVAQRVAAHLVRLVPDHGRPVEDGVMIDIPLSQQDIADQIGAALRTVARGLAVLRDRGIVETGRRQITIRRLSVLRALASSMPNGTERP